jgi:hypothetical protein
MSSPTLLVLAAGMGSRYGGLKQIDPMGPAGESLLDYSVFDAIRSGFGRVVFVIRNDIEEEFKRKVGSRYDNRVAVDYVFQELGNLPGGHKIPTGREKPWGTAHAIWCARDAVHEPFAAINADDFYGRNAYEVVGSFLRNSPSASANSASFCMAGYQLDRTLSEHGSVARGVCRISTGKPAYLLDIEEFTAIEKTGSGARQSSDGKTVEFSGNEPVSMNFWGFTPAVFPMLETVLEEFLSSAREDLKAECYIPRAVGQIVSKGSATVEVLETSSEWFGVTYREDKPSVMAALKRLTESGEYPSPLHSS